MKLNKMTYLQSLPIRILVVLGLPVIAAVGVLFLAVILLMAPIVVLFGTIKKDGKVISKGLI